MKTEKDIQTRVAEVQETLRVLRAYLQDRLQLEDWHGVEDAASDIRDNEAALRTLRWMLGTRG